MTHDEIRALLAGYAAGVLSDAPSAVVRAHLAEGCLDCLRDVFDRPVGLPPGPPAEREPPPVPAVAARSRPVQRHPVAIALGLSLVFIAVAVSMIAERPRRPGSSREGAADLVRELTATEELRASLAGRLAGLERAAASAESASREAEDARSAMAELQHELDAARLRIGSLKRTMRRQDTDFREKQQSLEAVIANLSRRLPPVAAARGHARQTACRRFAEPARGLCTAFCDVQSCDRAPAPACEPLRARFEALTGTREPPCAVATGSDTLAPCESSHVDVWSFAVTRGRQYTVTADTVEPGTEADLCLVGSCQGRDTFAGDDEIPCRSAPGVGCPRATFVAGGDASCVVAVTICSPGCGGRRSAPYEVTVEGADSLTLVADGVSSVTGEPADTF